MKIDRNNIGEALYEGISVFAAGRYGPAIRSGDVHRVIVHTDESCPKMDRVGRYSYGFCSIHPVSQEGLPPESYLARTAAGENIGLVCPECQRSGIVSKAPEKKPTRRWGGHPSDATCPVCNQRLGNIFPPLAEEGDVRRCLSCDVMLKVVRSTAFVLFEEVSDGS